MKEISEEECEKCASTFLMKIGVIEKQIVEKDKTIERLKEMFIKLYVETKTEYYIRKDDITVIASDEEILKSKKEQEKKARVEIDKELEGVRMCQTNPCGDCKHHDVGSWTEPCLSCQGTGESYEKEVK